MRLSICIATYARAAYLGATLENILEQADDRVEVLVVDGASPDNTPDVVAAVRERYPRLRYFRESVNSGVDQDFDKSVSYAQGDYCWLMSDDDVLAPGAVAAVLAAIEDGPELVVVNAEVRDRELATLLKASQLALPADREYSGGEGEALFAATTSYLSFIGGVVIRRSAWLARDRASYYGSLFIHIGVLCQLPALGRTKVLAKPLVRIRYGNAMWTARSFEIWVAKWPRLVWSFPQFSDAAKVAVVARNPAKSVKQLLWYRAIGAYGPAEYRSLLVNGQVPHHRLARLVAALPASSVNASVALYCHLRRHADAPMMLYDLERASCATWLSRLRVR